MIGKSSKKAKEDNSRASPDKLSKSEPIYATVIPKSKRAAATKKGEPIKPGMMGYFAILLTVPFFCS